MIARLVSSLYSGLFMVCKVDRVYDLGMFRISPFQGLTFRVAKTPQTKVHHFPKKPKIHGVPRRNHGPHGGVLHPSLQIFLDLKPPRCQQIEVEELLHRFHLRWRRIL